MMHKTVSRRALFFWHDSFDKYWSETNKIIPKERERQHYHIMIRNNSDLHEQLIMATAHYQYLLSHLIIHANERLSSTSTSLKSNAISMLRSNNSLLLLNLSCRCCQRVVPFLEEMFWLIACNSAKLRLNRTMLFDLTRGCGLKVHHMYLVLWLLYLICMTTETWPW